ncbi:MAG: leucine-rich repeat domain-containing protein [Clostridiales bacterium]|nr:leucine-rich repeat domain-containing protein [Clostridiales bacterium]
MKKLVFVILLCLLTPLCLCLVACEPTTKNVAGIYYLYDCDNFPESFEFEKDAYLQLKSDGTGKIVGNTNIEGAYDIPITYTLKGNKITVFDFDNNDFLTNGGIRDGVINLKDYGYLFCKENSKPFAKEFDNIVYTVGVDGNYEVFNTTNKEITSVKIKSKIGNVKVTSIGYNSFGVCAKLTSISIPKTITNIENDAFVGCTNLTDIKIPNSVTSIGNSVFVSCSNLTNIDIPNSVTSIGNAAFAYCSSLEKITIPDSVVDIGSTPFWLCTNLREVTFGSKVSFIAGYMFYGCDNLETIIVSKDNPKYYVVDNCVIEKETPVLAAACKNSIIPTDGSVTSLGTFAFASCGLEDILLPSSITEIDNYAFHQCEALKSITIPNSVASIGEGAFNGCKNLTDIIYNGTTEQWNAIKKASEYSAWDRDTGNYTIHCTDGDIAKGE